MAMGRLLRMRALLFLAGNGAAAGLDFDGIVAGLGRH
jgi:hypothetical protein